MLDRRLVAAPCVWVDAADVRTVLVDGRIVVQDRRLRTADEVDIRRDVRTLATSIGSLRAT